MKNKDFAALAERLSPNLPNFSVQAPLMFISPVGHTLRAICFESHPYEAKFFYVWVFFLPLFVPRKHVSFEFGKRVRGDRWDADAPNLLADLGTAVKQEALPLLSAIESPKDVAEAAFALRLPQNAHVQQAIAFAWARAGDVTRATEELDRLVRLVDVKIQWQREIAERAKALKEKLLINPADAERQLEAWETESSRNLGLEKFRQ